MIKTTKKISNGTPTAKIGILRLDITNLVDRLQC